MDQEKENVDPDFEDFQPLKRRRKGAVSPTKRFEVSTEENEIDNITRMDSFTLQEAFSLF